MNDAQSGPRVVTCSHKHLKPNQRLSPELINSSGSYNLSIVTSDLPPPADDCVNVMLSGLMHMLALPDVRNTNSTETSPTPRRMIASVQLRLTSISDLAVSSSSSSHATETYIKPGVNFFTCAYICMDVHLRSRSRCFPHLDNPTSCRLTTYTCACSCMKMWIHITTKRRGWTGLNPIQQSNCWDSRFLCLSSRRKVDSWLGKNLKLPHSESGISTGTAAHVAQTSNQTLWRDSALTCLSILVVCWLNVCWLNLKGYPVCWLNLKGYPVLEVTLSPCRLESKTSALLHQYRAPPSLISCPK